MRSVTKETTADQLTRGTSDRLQLIDERLIIITNTTHGLNSEQFIEYYLLFHI